MRQSDVLLFAIVLSCAHGTDSLPRPWISLNDEFMADKAPSVIYPFDAVTHGDKIYVAGGQHTVEVFSDGSWMMRLGKMGQGPGEFEHPPVRLDIRGGNLIATERYHHRELGFSLEGTYLFTRRPDENRTQKSLFGDLEATLQQLSFHKAGETGRMLRDLDHDCLLGRAVGPTEIDHHLSAFFLEEGINGEIVFIRRTGLVQVFESGCKLSEEWSVPVHHLTDDVIEDKWTNIVRKEYYAEKKPETRFRKAYRNGIPIISTALDHRGTLYILATDERAMTRDRKPGACELILLDLETGTTASFSLDWAPSRLRISENKLVLISSEDAMIMIWETGAFNL